MHPANTCGFRGEKQPGATVIAALFSRNIQTSFCNISPVNVWISAQLVVTSGLTFIVIWYKLQKTNIAMENPPFEDVFPIGKGGFPLPG